MEVVLVSKPWGNWREDFTDLVSFHLAQAVLVCALPSVLMLRSDKSFFPSLSLGMGCVCRGLMTACRKSV